MVQNGSFRFHSAAATHPGAVRKLNEDSFLDRADLGLWAVADGMGGHEAGDYASQTIVHGMHGLDPPESAPDFLAAVTRCLHESNRRLRESAAERGKTVIGSTVVVLLAFDGHFACLWAGDSRLYLLRDGALNRVTRDHSQVQELVDAGVLDPEEAERHPAANVITRAVGAADDLSLDICQGPLAPGDRFLLCSDGLVKAVSEAEIAEALRDSAPEEAAARLVDAALARQASDNVTAVLVEAQNVTET